MAGRFPLFSLEPSTWSARKSFEKGPQSRLIGAFRLAGLWNTWTDKVTGEVHESYTMLTIDTHRVQSQLFRRHGQGRHMAGGMCCRAEHLLSRRANAHRGQAGAATALTGKEKPAGRAKRE